MNINVMDIPRIYTGIAEWLACMVVASRLAPRMPAKYRIPIAGAALAVQCGFLVISDNCPIYLWIPCMVAAAAMMLGLILLLCDVDLAAGAYACIRAFVTAEFAASLQWQIHCFLWPQNNPVWWQRWGLLIAVYGAVYTLFALMEYRCNPGHSRPVVSFHELLSAFIMGVCIFSVSNLSFVYQRTPFSSQHASDILNIRTIVDLCGVAILYAYHLQRREDSSRKELAAMQTILENQYAQYRMSRDSIELVNQKYHDLKHQIAALRAESDAEVRNRWLDEMEEDILAYEAQNKTGNTVLDTVLTGKGLYCRKHSIELIVVADGRNLEMMEMMDICSLFGNALDNAIECELKQPDKSKRMIHLSLTSQKQFLLLQVENFCPDIPVFRNGLPITTKPDRENHGFGVKSIQSIARKYGGSASFQVSNGWFVLKVLLPLPKETREPSRHTKS